MVHLCFSLWKDESGLKKQVLCVAKKCDGEFGIGEGKVNWQGGGAPLEALVQFDDGCLLGRGEEKSPPLKNASRALWQVGNALSSGRICKSRWFEKWLFAVPSVRFVEGKAVCLLMDSLMDCKMLLVVSSSAKWTSLLCLLRRMAQNRLQDTAGGGGALCQEASQGRPKAFSCPKERAGRCPPTSARLLLGQGWATGWKSLGSTALRACYPSLCILSWRRRTEFSRLGTIRTNFPVLT